MLKAEDKKKDHSETRTRLGRMFREPVKKSSDGILNAPTSTASDLKGVKVRLSNRKVVLQDDLLHSLAEAVGAAEW